MKQESPAVCVCACVVGALLGYGETGGFLVVWFVDSGCMKHLSPVPLPLFFVCGVGVWVLCLCVIWLAHVHMLRSCPFFLCGGGGVGVCECCKAYGGCLGTRSR